MKLIKHLIAFMISILIVLCIISGFIAFQNLKIKSQQEEAIEELKESISMILQYQLKDSLTKEQIKEENAKFAKIVSETIKQDNNKK